MATPSTVATYALNNSQRDFDVTFDYLSQTFVQVSLIGTTTQVLSLGSDFVFLSPTVIRTTLTYGPPDWSYIEVRRVTSTTERLVEFNDASVLHANELNLSDLQVIHIAEEARNSATETIGVDNNGNLDARGRRLVNVADPVELGDAITVRWYQAEVDGTHADRLAAEAAKVAAEAARDQSVTAKVASETARDVSVAAAATTASNVTASGNNATAAAASAAEALGYRNTTLTYRNEAQGFRDTAESHKNAAAASAAAASNSADLAAASAASINDANLLHKTGDETAAGQKTFSSLFTASGGANVTNGLLHVYGYTGNNNLGRVLLNQAGTAGIVYDGTDVRILTPAGSGGLATKYMKVLAADGEGGEIRLGKATGSALNGDVIVDMNDANLFRIFESASPFRGVAIDLTNGGADVTARLTHSNLPASAVGQLVLAQQVAGTRCDYGNLISGNDLRPSTGNGWTGISSPLPGTWRALGQVAGSTGGADGAAVGLWIRVL